MAADDELARINAEIRRSRKLLEDDRAEVAKAEQALSAFRLEEELLGQRADQLKEQRQAAQSTLSARRSRLESLAGQLARVRREIAAADSDVDKRVRVLDSRRRDLEGLRDALTEARAEARGLEEVDRAFASASPALAWALAQERALPGLVGPVAEAIRAPQHYEVLVERLLGADLFGLLVADFESASGISSQIVAHTAGEMSLMPLLGSRTRLQGTPSAGRRLIDDLSYDDSVRAAVEALLGDVFVVGSIDEALELSVADETGARFATVDGAVVWPTGKLTLGTQVGDTEGVLARKRRLNELNDDMGALTASVGAAESVLMDAEEALAAAQQDALELSQKVAALTGEHDSLLEEVGRLEQQMRSLDTEAEGVEERISDIRLRTAKDRPTATALTDRIAACETELERLEEGAVVSREQRDLRFREESAVSERLSTCQVEIATVSEREVHLKRQVNTITSELRELEETVRSARESEIAFELLRQRIQPVHDLYVVLQERADHWAHKLKDRARFEQADSESLRETIQTAQAAVREVQSEIDEKSESATELRVEKGQLEVQVNQAVRRIVEELGIPLETALGADELDNRSVTEDRAHRLRKQISNLGPVNPIAMEEFESLRSRREFMVSQIEDLDSSRRALQKVVAAIDRKMRDRFMETFEVVDRSFQEVFALLFPGGTAQLQLTDPDDPDLTGVEVIAQPRGKKLSKMTLMSGGEKSLTALALLFAVYRTRPCPFYILDEVEAALDDTNLRRFVAFVDSMRSMTQFIVVTHQRRTMEMADVLYGVSMQADGVSKVVSQKLDRTQADAKVADEHALV